MANKSRKGVIFLQEWNILIDHLSPKAMAEFWELFRNFSTEKPRKPVDHEVKIVWAFIEKKLTDHENEYKNRVLRINQLNAKNDPNRNVLDETARKVKESKVKYSKVKESKINIDDENISADQFAEKLQNDGGRLADLQTRFTLGGARSTNAIIQKFCLHCKDNGKDVRTFTEHLSHFINWLKKQPTPPPDKTTNTRKYE